MQEVQPPHGDGLRSPSSALGTVLSHDYVTSLYVNDGIALPDGLRLYGSEKRCREKGIGFKTKVQLACELIEEHKGSQGKGEAYGMALRLPVYMP
jgi:hypothetical protein